MILVIQTSPQNPRSNNVWNRCSAWRYWAWASTSRGPAFLKAGSINSLWVLASVGLATASSRGRPNKQACHALAVGDGDGGIWTVKALYWSGAHSIVPTAAQVKTAIANRLPTIKDRRRKDPKDSALLAGLAVTESALTHQLVTPIDCSPIWEISPESAHKPLALSPQALVRWQNILSKTRPNEPPANTLTTGLPHPRHRRSFHPLH